jgi:hypothetical protein
MKATFYARLVVLKSFVGFQRIEETCLDCDGLEKPSFFVKGKTSDRKRSLRECKNSDWAPVRDQRRAIEVKPDLNLHSFNVIKYILNEAHFRISSN